MLIKVSCKAMFCDRRWLLISDRTSCRCFLIESPSVVGAAVGATVGALVGDPVGLGEENSELQKLEEAPGSSSNPQETSSQRRHQQPLADLPLDLDLLPGIALWRWPPG